MCTQAADADPEQVKEAFGVSYTQVELAITVFNIGSAMLQTPTGSW